MKKQIKNLVYVCICCGVLGAIPVLLSKSKPIMLNVSEMDLTTLTQSKEQEGRDMSAASGRGIPRAFRCTVDDDCIIVAKDPCGCLLGPQGVAAVNVEHALYFAPNDTGTKTCPSMAPSTEAQCSPTAQAVCQANRCTITY